MRDRFSSERGRRTMTFSPEIFSRPQHRRAAGRVPHLSHVGQKGREGKGGGGSESEGKGQSYSDFANFGRPTAIVAKWAGRQVGERTEINCLSAEVGKSYTEGRKPGLDRFPSCSPLSLSIPCSYFVLPPTPLISSDDDDD